MKGDNGNVGIGTTAPAYKLSVNGSIQAKEVIVNTGWSDYVFQPHYHLTALKDVAAYIKANHHLPEIPSETEVQKKGAGLGAMQVKLLAKIEELTLYLVQADERNRELQDRVARLEALGFPSAVKVADHRGQHGQLNRGSQKRRRAHLGVSSLGRTEARDDSN